MPPIISKLSIVVCNSGGVCNRIINNGLFSLLFSKFVASHTARFDLTKVRSEIWPSRSQLLCRCQYSHFPSSIKSNFTD